MHVRRVVPNIRANDLAATRDFYIDTLGFQVVMDHGWIVTVSAPGDPQRQISIVGTDATAPVHPDISIEVEDVDAAYAKARQQGHEIVHPLTDEPWGVRRFFCRDPSGTVLNILSHR
ncbi:VOC family protein [Saccharopolyspora phatthalungensis]|uniref:Catechol 2,3-dioxygenase-like lactoylglutathione lyase family enzyme n=1 Tax=Saccharopolyspora phatthalungensis TaxID=664693 RepID=A0A840Q8D0_9PSEU|nr:VOC family protein [Saccharopolyspora phatthalungensis]MBB5154879.1 catechol 2,3-dioxygenase-like lactoylglutathione lyase family enzyme [Saccharopolyspora phatthalungensis]